MVNWKKIYKDLCKQHKFVADPDVLTSLEKARDETEGCIDFSKKGLSERTCQVLAELFADSESLFELRFADSLLSEESLRLILGSLCQNTSLRLLDLRGNNIGGHNIARLGKLLRHHPTLVSLLLEWNSLGESLPDFVSFCEGLSATASLQKLDLQNNRLNLEAAEELAQTLKHNSSLLEIDLRWNSVGNRGGRALLQALSFCPSIRSVKLEGNNISEDLVMAIRLKLSQQSLQLRMDQDNQSHADFLSAYMERSQAQQKFDLEAILNRVCNQEKLLEDTVRDGNFRISRLEQLLAERSKALHISAERLSSLEESLSLSEEKNAALEALLAEREHQLTCTKKELTQLQEEHFKMEATLLKQLSEERNRGIDIQQQMAEAERAALAAETETSRLNEQLRGTQSKVAALKDEHNSFLAQQKTQYTEMMKEVEERYEQQVERMRTHSVELEMSLRNRVTALEKKGAEQESQIVSLESQLHQAKATAEEEKSSFQKKMKLLERQYSQQAEAQLEKERTEKASLEIQLDRQKSNTVTLQLKLENVQEISQELARKLKSLQQEASTSQAQHDHEKKRADKAEYEAWQLQDEMHKLKEELHKAIDEKENAELCFHKKEKELNQFRVEEIQRASLLQTAVSTYLGNIAPVTPRSRH